jgi:hypothetical protein
MRGVKSTRRFYLFIGTLALLGCNNKTETRSETGLLLNSADKVDGKDGVKTRGPALTIENLAVGQFALRSSSSTRIATRAIIEHRNDDGRWIPYDKLDGANGYRVVDRCPQSGDMVPACRAIKTDEIIVPVFWNGQHCSAQCAPTCTSDSYLAGAHRFVVQDCEKGKIRYQSPIFEMPRSVKMVARWQVASRAERATVYRLDPAKSKDPMQVYTSDRVVGYSIRSTGNRNVDKKFLVDLSRWLTRTSFEDDLVQRCLPGLTIGIVILNTLPNGAEDRSELAIDFGCNTLLILRDQGGKRRLTSTLFDKSRDEVLALMQRALPEDKELLRIK